MIKADDNNDWLLSFYILELSTCEFFLFEEMMVMADRRKYDFVDRDDFVPFQFVYACVFGRLTVSGRRQLPALRVNRIGKNIVCQYYTCTNSIQTPSSGQRLNHI